MNVGVSLLEMLNFDEHVDNLLAKRDSRLTFLL